MGNKKSIKLYAGVSIMTLALLMHMNMNISGNSKTKEIAFNDFKQIEIPKNDQEVKRKGR